MIRITPSVANAVVVCVCWCLLTGALTAAGAGLLPRYRFENLATRDQDGVHALLQDSQGLIWAGTDSGLMRLESGRLLRAPDRPKHTIYDLWEQPGQGLLIAHEAGLARWERATDRWLELPCSEAESGMRQFLAVEGASGSTTDDAKLLGLTRSGMVSIDPSSGRCTAMRPAGLPQGRAIERLGLVDDELLLAVRESGLYRCALPCEQAVAWAPKLAQTRVRMLETVGPSLYVGTHKHGLYRLDHDGQVSAHWRRRTDAEEGLPTSGAMSLVAGAQGSIWVGMWAGGLVQLGDDGRILGSSRDVATDASSLSGANVGVLLQGLDGALYAGHEAGLSVLLPQANQWPWIGTANDYQTGFGRPEVQALYCEDAQRFWVGTSRSGLYHVDLQSNTLRAFSDQRGESADFPSHSIWDIQLEAGGTLAVATSAGVVRMQPQTFQWRWLTESQPLPSQDVFRLAVAPSAELWIAMWSGGVARLSHDGQLLRTWSSADGLGIDTSGSIAVSAQGDVFVLNSAGAFRLPAADIDAPNSLFQSLALQPADSGAAQIQQLAQVADGQINALDQYGSLWRWDHAATSFQRLRSPQAVSADADKGPLPFGVRLLADTGAGSGANFWYARGEQLIGVDAQGGHLRQASLAALGMYSRPNDLCLQPGAATMVVATQNGVHIVALNEPSLTAPAVAPIVSGVLLFNQPYRLTTAEQTPASVLFAGGLSLRYDQDLLSVQWGVPGIQLPPPSFRYRLAPFDRDWNSAAEGDFRATYTRLPPGEYQFEVEALQPDGSALRSQPFAIAVLPPWWLTWWAYLLALLLVFALALLLLQWRTLRLRQRNLQLEHSVQERTVDLEVANRRLADVASRDALTGLNNRRGLRETLDTRTGEHGGLLLIIDLDHFKQLNDRFGHHVGDEVLVETARRMREAMAPRDLLARWGGEEFVACMYGPQALQRAQALQRCTGTPLMALSVGPIQVTMTVGAVNMDSGDLDDLLQRADALLYQGKAAGRDRLIAE